MRNHFSPSYFCVKASPFVLQIDVMLQIRLDKFLQLQKTTPTVPNIMTFNDCRPPQLNESSSTENECCSVF